MTTKKDTVRADILVRAYEPQDFDALADIMFDTWYALDAQHADDEEKSRLRLLSRFDTAHYLATSTHVLVAVQLEGVQTESGLSVAGQFQTASSVAGQLQVSDQSQRVLGTAMWRNDTDWDKGISLENYACGHIDAVLHSAHNDANLTQKISDFNTDDAHTQALAEPIASKCQAELRLFMVNAQAKGRGVGSALLRRAQNSMKESGALRYYLYTDSTCDYEFYEHRGMTRAAQELHVKTAYGHILDKFIYMCTLK